MLQPERRTDAFAGRSRRPPPRERGDGLPRGGRLRHRCLRAAGPGAVPRHHLSLDHRPDRVPRHGAPGGREPADASGRGGRGRTARTADHPFGVAAGHQRGHPRVRVGFGHGHAVHGGAREARPPDPARRSHRPGGAALRSQPRPHRAPGPVRQSGPDDPAPPRRQADQAGLRNPQGSGRGSDQGRPRRRDPDRLGPEPPRSPRPHAGPGAAGRRCEQRQPARRRSARA